MNENILDDPSGDESGRLTMMEANQKQSSHTNGFFKPHNQLEQLHP